MTQVNLSQSTQRSGLVVVATIMIIVGALGVVLGLFMPALIGGTAILIAGAVVLVGGVLVWTGVALVSWWQFESRQQIGLLARGLDEALSRDEAR